jgi:MFS family permease
LKAPAQADPDGHQSAFAQPVFRRYFPAACFSTFGSWIVRFLLGWSAWELTESAFWVGVTAGLMLFPTFLLSPIFGIVSDRVNPRNGLLLTVVSQVLLALVAGLVTLLGDFSLPWLLALATGLGCITAANAPMRLALIPRLVPRQALPSAVGISAIVFNTSRILGPAAAAWMTSQVSITTAFFGAMGLLCGALPFLFSIRCEPREQGQESDSLRAQFAAGLRYVASHEGIKLVFGFALINGMLGRTVIELLPALSGQMLDGEPATLATLTASAGAGSILGGLMMSRQGSDEGRLLRLLTTCLLASAVTLFVAGWLQGMMAMAALVVVLSLVTTMVGTGTQVMSQLLVEDAYRGRVLSLWTVVAMGVPAIGALLMGGLADRLGFPLVLPGFALTAAGATILLFRHQGTVRERAQGASMREYPDAAPEEST